MMVIYASRVFVSVKTESPCQYIVHADTVIEIFMDTTLRKKFDDVYRLKNLLKSNLFKGLSEMTFDAHPIHIVITRNKQVAEAVKKSIMAKF